MSKEYALAINPESTKTPNTKCKTAKIKRVCDALLFKIVYGD